jgi:hypothetical protein
MNRRKSIYIIILLLIASLLVAEYVLKTFSVFGNMIALESMPIFFKQDARSAAIDNIAKGESAKLLECVDLKGDFYLIVESARGVKGVFWETKNIKWQLKKGSLLNFNETLAWQCPMIIRKEI